MDSSPITDKFYSHFPSYSEQSTKREALAKARQLEYQTYLSRIASNGQNSNGKSNKRITAHDKHTKRPKLPINHDEKESPKLNGKHVSVAQTEATNGAKAAKVREMTKEKFLDGVENMNLPEIFDEDRINARNRRMAEEKRSKTIRYQQDLMAQIEQKKREKELRKAKEREEEERLTRRMEEQLKSVRLQYEMEQERPTRRREHKRINMDYQKALTIGHSPPKPPITVRSEQIEPAPYTYRSYDERKAQSENGKENINVVKRNDNEIYKFFKNSARDPNLLKDLRYHNYCDFSGELSDFDITPNSMSSAYNTYPSTASHQIEIKSNRQPPMCNFCKQHRFLARSQQENIEKDLYFCGSCEMQPICLNCRKEICVRCKRPTNDQPTKPIIMINDQPRNDELDLWQPRADAGKDAKYVRTEQFRPIETDEESLTDSNPDGHKPYSFNIAESSVFHPSHSRIDRRLSVSIKNGEVSVQPDSFDELKRITNEKLMKYAKTYGALRNKRAFDMKQNKLHQNDSNPLPLIKENTKKLMDFAKQLERDDDDDDNGGEPHQGYSKWPVNGEREQYNDTQKNSEQNAFTFTQVGAFKKQLHLNKFNIDDY